MDANVSGVTRTPPHPVSERPMMTRPTLRLAAAGGALALLAACASPNRSPAQQSATNTLTPEEQAQGWRLLFDGRTTAGWRGYQMPAMPTGWQVVDGALTRVGDGADIITTDQYANFELSLEWKVAPKGNSGIMYRVTEADSATYRTGPEMQVLDDAGHRDGLSRLTAAGAAYGLYPAPEGVVKPAGEWNQARIVVTGNHVEHWLNGVKMADYELLSRDWEARMAKTKFAEWPGFGRAPKGHIALQDHGDWVAYRNFKIRVLP
jgi:hypothetical protein